MSDNIEVKIGSVWKTGSHASPFASGVEFKVTDIVGGLIRYQYDNGTSGHKPATTFREFVRNGTLTPKAVEPAKPLRFQPGQCWVTVRSLCPLKLGVRFEILRIEGQKVYYKYLDKTSENYRFISDLEAYFEKDWIIPAPTDAQTPTKRWEGADPFANPFKAHASPFEVGLDIKQVCERTRDAIFGADYAKLEERAAAASVASVPARIQELLSKYQGQRFTSALMHQLDHEIRMLLPVGLTHNLICDAGGQNLRVELDGLTESYRIESNSVQFSPKGSSSQKKVYKVEDLKLSIGGQEIQGFSGQMILEDNEESKPVLGEQAMTRIVNVFILDQTAGLKAAERLIGKVENFASDARDNTTMLLELSMEHDLKGMLHDHNKRRKAIINQDILNRVGKTVYLQPIELKDVKIDIKVVTEV